ncbi:MAG: Uncharacterised protein [Marinobacterium sp. xm-d-530]|nr:MAG: Uncharacterised protein [Marinobacterium sp. xm-d-530]
MSEQRHPDIEVYVKDRTAQQILEWVETLGTLTNHKTAKDSIKATLIIDNEEIPVLIQQRVIGKAWSTVWFDSSETHWATDLECAHQIAKAMETQTRCVDSGWQEGDEPDEWYKVHQGVEEKIVWNTN